jgi:hypothetical protein
MKQTIREIRRAASMRSSWRFAAHSVDTGQRYEVVYRDGTGTLRIFGYAHEYRDTIPLVDKIAGNLMWSAPSVRDRLKMKV